MIPYLVKKQFSKPKQEVPNTNQSVISEDTKPGICYYYDLQLYTISYMSGFHNHHIAFRKFFSGHILATQKSIMYAKQLYQVSTVSISI